MMSTARKRTRSVSISDDDSNDISKRPRASTDQPTARPLPIRSPRTSDATDPSSLDTDDSMDLDLTPTLTELSSSWPTQRRTDSLFSRPVRPKPYPLQRPQSLGPTPPDDQTPRPPGSPGDTSTPTARLSQLSVSDMDVDAKPEPALRWRGRQRSGAFIGGGESTRRSFQMGYREDCEKCRLRTPGHMNHFLDKT